MQSAGFSSASSQIRNDSLSRLSTVATATPAKRITFYKSGDNQFSGIRMPIHKRSFKCFDALLDDLSQKISLPFGVRTITTPRGTHAIQSLEQLQDGACYLCSDRHYVKPIDMEVAGKQTAVWHHNYPLNTPRMPSRPDELPTGQSAHHYHQHLKRIVLVKNSDPALKRSIVLSKKRTRSLRVFMDEISELMQYNVRKLHTLEGRKIESMQSLMQCPSVLVCVGREPFNPLLLEHLRKNSEEKLPGIGVRSHSSIYSEGHDSKKNVNFGLETKKSIIHPRSDSSNKSTRFSLSSEKSYPNGSGMTPGLGCVTKEVVMNDDVEKRVLVNKDGSLSVEMKVRFRLVSDETLQWSTKIKKLPTSINECSTLQEEEPHCLQGKAVYSEPESNAECEEACSSKCNQMDIIESYCQNCCRQNQGYDIWKNPLHKDNRTSGTRSSSNSAGSSDKIMHQKASVNKVYTVSRSSEEYTEHVIEKASCVQQTTEKEDTRIAYCSISCCCSRSEVSNSMKKCNEPTDTCENNIAIMCHHNDHQTADYVEVEHLSKVTQLAENLISATSNSSIVQLLKKDEKDDYDDLSPSVSRASQWCSEHDKQFKCVHCYGCPRSQNLHSSSVPPKVLSYSANTLKSKLDKSIYAAPEVSTEGHSDSTNSPTSFLSKVSSSSPCCCCSQCKDAPTSLVESEMKSGLKERLENAEFDDSTKTKTHSPWTEMSDSNVQKACKVEHKSRNRSVSDMSMSNTCFSFMSTVCPCCGGCGRLPSTIPAKVENTGEEDFTVKSFDQGSSKSPEPERSNKCTQKQLDFISELVQNRVEKSNKSDQLAYGRTCDAEMISENAAEEGFGGRTESPMSVKSIGSAKRNTDIPDKLGLEKKTVTQENITETENVTQDFDIVPSETSTKTNSSKDHDKTNKFKLNHSQDTVTASSPVSTSPTIDTCQEKILSEKSSIVLSKDAKALMNSNACSDDDDVESGLSSTDMTKGQNTRQITEDAKYNAQRSFSVASSSPKSPPTAENYNQTSSVKSVNSRASLMSTRCMKLHCSTGICVQKVANSPLGVSKFSALNGLLDEPLTPTSTASVSLELGAEEQSKDLNAQIFHKPTYLPEEHTFKPSTLTHALNNSAIIGTTKRDKTAVSTCSIVSDKTQLSNYVQDPCKIPKVTSGALTDSIISTKSKTESRVEVQLLQNDDHIVLSSLSGTSGKNSPSKNTSRIEINTNTDNGENNNALSISGSSFKSSQNKKKSTTIRSATPKDQYTTKSKKKSSSKLETKKIRKNYFNSTTSVISPNASKSDTEPSPRNKYANRYDILQITPDSKGNSFLHHPPDLLRKKVIDVKPDSRKPSSRKISTSSQNKTEDHDKEALMPFCLPNASPTDVVNDWLKNIPVDGPTYEMEDGFTQQHDKTLLYLPVVKEGCFQYEIRDHSDIPVKMLKSKEISGHEVADPVTEVKNTVCEANLASNKTFQTFAVNSEVSSKLTKRESLTNNCQSSIQVMKVLLSQKLDRCNSLPEVSPTYGRKLSTSVKGLLDCLANLQMIDPDPMIYDKYIEMISTLQSLWINRSSETVLDKHNKMIHSAQDEFNIRSSSGVDLSSGSIGSGKGSISAGLKKSDMAQDKTLIAKEKALLQNQGDATSGGEGATPENIYPSPVCSDPITPDIAERIQCSPKQEKLNKEAQKEKGFKGTGDDSIQYNEHIKDTKQIDLTFSKSSSENVGNVKSAADNESVSPENNNLRTSAPDQGKLTKRISQDPDPVWVLSLLKKLEKQFMSHYANAIAEFKVRWDLNDNETLDIMISELKEEVHKKIQSTINRELQKIQSRAGKTPRPPISMLSRDSIVRTEQRRRRLKVMQNKLINPSRSKDNNTASGTELSDQRSEDEYCPCDTCVKKKMASRVVQSTEALKVAPVLKEFDLRKILQTKKEHPVTMSVCKPHKNKDQFEDVDTTSVQYNDNLEVVKQGAKIQACKNQGIDLGEVNHGEGMTVKETSSEEPRENKIFDNNFEGADDGEGQTEIERHKVGEDLEDRLKERKDKEAEEAKEEKSKPDKELAMEIESPDEPAAKRKESSDIDEREENSVVEKELNDEKPEEEVSERGSNKRSETEKAKEEEGGQD